MKDTVIFDMDGVLFDSEQMYIQEIIDFFRENNISLSLEKAKQIIGVDDTRFYQLLTSWWQSDKGDFLTKYEVYDRRLIRNYLPIVNLDIYTLLAYLKKNHYKVALASNSHVELIHHALKQTGLFDYFDYIASGENFERSKPDPMIYLDVVDSLHSTIDRCLIIEDSTPGIQAAINAKIDVLALKDTRFGMKQDHATKVINTLLDVIPYLEEV